ncbi:MAG: hypothetical protein WC612_07595 [Bdellovibrionales bacterium]|jgi:hypothetical protein
MNKTWQKAWVTVGGLALGLGLCVFLFLHVHLTTHDFAVAAQSFSIGPCLVVLFLTYLLMLMGARKWALLSASFHGAAGREPSCGFFMRHTLWQNWIGQFVPPSVAIVAGRGLATRTMEGASAKEGLWSGLWDQGMEFALLCGFLLGAFGVLGAGYGWAAFFALSALGLGLIAGGARVGRRWLPVALRPILWPALGWSLARVSLTILRLVAGIGATGALLSPLNVVVATPVTGLLALIPLTPGNLGLAEWGWQGVLAYAGENPVQAALYPVAFRVLVFVAQSLLLGGYEAFLFIINGKNKG